MWYLIVSIPELCLLPYILVPCSPILSLFAYSPKIMPVSPCSPEINVPFSLFRKPNQWNYLIIFHSTQLVIFTKLKCLICNRGVGTVRRRYACTLRHCDMRMTSRICRYIKKVIGWRLRYFRLEVRSWSHEISMFFTRITSRLIVVSSKVAALKMLFMFIC